MQSSSARRRMKGKMLNKLKRERKRKKAQVIRNLNRVKNKKTQIKEKMTGLMMKTLQIFKALLALRKRPKND